MITSNLLAERITRLGTETAFAVSAEANDWAAQGNKIYPFHLGDINITTPQNIIDAAFKAANEGSTGYCPNAGIPALREALATDIGSARGINYSAANIAVQPGGKPSIGKFVLTLMNPGDEVLYPNPGYPIYESQIEFNGGVAVPYGFEEGPENFVLNIGDIESKINSRTRLLIYNNLHNPTGAESTPDEMQQLAELAKRHDLIVLSDEAYFDMRYSGTSTSIASLPGMKERTVILYTFSKKFAMTGWRLGATIGPEEIIAAVAKVNINDESCSNHFIQYGAIEALTGDQSGVQKILDELRIRRDIAHETLARVKGVRCYKPDATFYLFPNVTELMASKGFDDYEIFRRQVLQDTGVAFCTRLHFGRQREQEAEKYVRFAYSGINPEDINEGLQKLVDWSQQ